MTKKPGFWKCIMGVVVLSLLFVAVWATTSARLTSAKINWTSTLTSRGAAIAAPTPTGTDPITGVIELDGDITDAGPGPTPDDWDTLNCDGGNALVKTGVIADGLNASIFTGAEPGGNSKDPDPLSGWRHKDGNVPDKDELLNAYAAKYVGSPDGDSILTFGADRYANTGTAFIGFWFFQNPVFAASDGLFREGPLPSDPVASHLIGDLLVLIEFTQGGAIATAKVFEWVGTGGSEAGGTLNDITGTAPIGAVFSISNGSAQVIPGTCAAWVHDPKSGPDGTIQTNSFFEGAINLDAFPALAGTCFSSFLVETRTSASVSSTLKDFVLGQFNTCAAIEVTKTADSNAVCAGHTTTYTYVPHNTSGVVLNVTLVDDNETVSTADDIDVPTCMPLSSLPLGEPTVFMLQPDDGVAGSGTDQQTFTCNRVLSVGSHTNVVTVTASFGSSTATDTDDETVVVSPNPTADAGLDQSVCDTSPHIFNMAATVTGAPPGTITWSVDSNSTGAAVQISDVNAEDPTVTLNGFGSVTLKLFVSNPATGPSCVTAEDTVVLTLSQNPAANAGADKQACETDPSHVFALSDATSTVPTGGTRTWTVTNNTTGQPVLISDVNAANPSVTLQGFGTAELTQTITNPATGTGCVGASDAVVLTLDQNPVVTIADVACNAADGGTELLLVATVSAGGGPGTTFLWSGPSGGIVSGQGTDTITVNKPGTYTVTVTNGASCSSMKSKNVGLCAADAVPEE